MGAELKRNLLVYFLHGGSLELYAVERKLERKCTSFNLTNTSPEIVRKEMCPLS